MDLVIEGCAKVPFVGKECVNFLDLGNIDLPLTKEQACVSDKSDKLILGFTVIVFAAIVGGGALFIILLIVCCCCCCKTRKQGRHVILTNQPQPQHVQAYRPSQQQPRFHPASHQGFASQQAYVV